MNNLYLTDVDFDLAKDIYFEEVQVDDDQFETLQSLVKTMNDVQFAAFLGVTIPALQSHVDLFNEIHGVAL